MTLTFDPRSPNSNLRPNRCIRLAGIFFTRSAGHTDTQTGTQTNFSENITPPRFRGGVKDIDDKKKNMNDMNSLNETLSSD